MNIIIMKKFETAQELSKCEHRHNVSKYCWKNGANRCAQHSVATNVQFVLKKNAVAVKHKGKCKKTRSACRGRRHSAASHDRRPLSYQLALRKPESVRDSGFTCLWLLGHGCPHGVTLESKTWSCVRCSTATTSLRHMVASSLAFFPGLCSLGDLRDLWAHLIKLHSHPGELQKQWSQKWSLLGNTEVSRFT